MTKKALLKEALVMKYDVVKDDNLKPLQVKYFNYYYVIKKVNIARPNNYYYVINRICNHSQTERYLLKIH